MSEIEEAMSSSSNNINRYSIEIGENGTGNTTTGNLGGFLEYVVLSEHLSIFTISIKSVEFPEMEILNLKREEPDLRVLPIRMPLFDNNGHNIQELGKIPLIGKYIIDITSAVPSTKIEVTIISSK
jgi:hypothetical protein